MPAISLRAQRTPLTDEGKSKLNRFFAALRKSQIEARQNFRCCQTCALAELATILAEDPSRVGYAFYHKQDGAQLEEQRGVYVAFGANPSAGWTDDGIARVIVNAAQISGLYVYWNGDSAARIYVSEVPVS